MPCVGVGRAGGDERRHRAGFGDALFEDLAVLRFLVVEQRVDIDRLVELADVRVDADLAEQALPCRRCALRRERSARSACRCFRRAAACASMRTKTIVVEALRPSRALGRTSSKILSAGRFNGRLFTTRCGKYPPSSSRRSLQVFHLRAVFGRTVERQSGDFFVGDRNAEARAELAQLLFVELLLLVRDVAAFAGFAQSVALDRLAPG